MHNYVIYVVPKLYPISQFESEEKGTAGADKERGRGRKERGKSKNLQCTVDDRFTTLHYLYNPTQRIKLIN
jgi:hypothetical protein